MDTGVTVLLSQRQWQSHIARRCLSSGHFNGPLRFGTAKNFLKHGNKRPVRISDPVEPGALLVVVCVSGRFVVVVYR